MSELMTDPEQFRQQLLQDRPFLDVRAEIEFAKGALPTAHNLPILDTDERHQIGLVYKQQGQPEAIKLGHQLVSGALKEQRIKAWCDYATANPDAALYCWRGGMRSNLTQQWMREAGVDIPLVQGGYKALRRLLLAEIEAAAASPMVVIGGSTGTAKTPLIQALNTGIDLEGFAHHRGSSFGRRVQEPPAQVDFENSMAIELLKKRHSFPASCLFFEDESRMIGPASLPLALWQGMSEADIAVVTMPLDFRVQRILQEYVQQLLAEYLQEDPLNGAERYRQHLLSSLFRVRKRLGSERYKQYHTIMESALDQQIQHQRVCAHEQWIEAMLTDYYDPMYEYQLASKQARVVFSGDYQQVLEWAQDKQSAVEKAQRV
jgi:tRNA 2-selenouridine synthase